MSSRFGITTTIDIQVSVLGIDDTIISLNEAGNVMVNGDLVGAPSRVVTLTADESSSLGYKFKEWIIETSPITLVPVVVGGFTRTLEEMCGSNIPGFANEIVSTQTELSNTIYTNDEFFYDDVEGNRVSNSGFYGAGFNSYYIHDTAQGITGPFVCGASSGAGGSSGGGNEDEILPDQS